MPRLTPLTIRLDKSAAWQRKEGKNPEGGLNAKGIASYRREHPGSKLSLAVTTEPSKLKPGSVKAERRRRFCSRMSGMKAKLTSAKTANDPNSRINKSLRKWNCDAPEAGTTDRVVAAEFFKTLLDAVTTGHLLHLQSNSFSQHSALNTFYSELEELTDGLIESYQGKYGIVTGYPKGPSMPNSDAVSFMTKLSDYVRSTRAAVASDSELQNDIDSIQSLIDSTLYKLTNLR